MWLKQRFRFNGYLDVKKIKVAFLQVLQINQQFCGRTCDRKTNYVNYRINLLDLCWSKESSNWALVHNVFNVRSIIVNTQNYFTHEIQSWAIKGFKINNLQCWDLLNLAADQYWLVFNQGPLAKKAASYKKTSLFRHVQYIENTLNSVVGLHTCHKDSFRL